MNILVDTSVWVDHFRRTNVELGRLLASDRVLLHPMVLIELACGTPPSPRERTLRDIGVLRQSNQASLTEVLEFVEKNRLFGKGCGLVDVALLASVLITPGARLWTLDKRLENLAREFSVAYEVSTQ